MLNPNQQLKQAVSTLSHHSSLKVSKVSKFYDFPAIGGPSGQPNYLNAVLRGQSNLSAPNLLQVLLNIETEQGRVRSIPNAARTLDLDLLLYGFETIESPMLNLPHPRILERQFVLQPLEEICSAAEYQDILIFLKSIS